MNAKAIPAVPVGEEKLKAQQTHLWCDLASARAFARDHERPHLPVLTALGAGPLHECSLRGVFDLDRAITENQQALVRSVRRLPPQSDRSRATTWDDLTFQFGPQCFLYADALNVEAYATTAQAAEHLVAWFAENYGGKPPEEGGAFYLIQLESDFIGCQRVALSTTTVLHDSQLQLHYGEHFAEWHRWFAQQLTAKPNGLSILEGSPGTGKSCYLRHLLGTLKQTHRFYFISPSTIEVLSRPDFIGFWASQRRQHADLQFVVILEDSDAALMTRGSDNRTEVSAILNLSDGLLADFLKLQIICTINCRATEIDQALLRPGRLLCHRVFQRLTYVQAARLAEGLGRTLPVASDYSLAEVFAGPAPHDQNRHSLGFGG